MTDRAEKNQKDPGKNSGNGAENRKQVRGNTGRDHRRKGPVQDPLMLLSILTVFLLVAVILCVRQKKGQEQQTVETLETTAVSADWQTKQQTEPETEPETTLSSEELEDLELREKVEASISGYHEFGVLLSDGSVNFRSSPDSSQAGNKIGQLYDLDVCDRLESSGDWYMVDHEGVTGYVYAEYCLQGEEARRQARLLLGKEASDLIKDPVIIQTQGNEVRIFREPVFNDMSLVNGCLVSGACFDILGEEEDSYHIISGEIEGYIQKDRCALGDQAILVAQIKSKERLRVKASILNLRDQPFYATGTVIGQMKAGEQAEVVEKELSPADGSGWVRIRKEISGPDGAFYETACLNIGGNNAEVSFGLETAVETDARELVLEGYEEPLVCVTTGYVNIRESTTTKSYTNIIGKIYPGNGAELLETVSPEASEDGGKWYRIYSGGVMGYVSAGTDGEEWFAFGERAREVAPAYAKLTARITADVLNVRSTPSSETDENVWTQVTRGQAYEVLDQAGDWVRIDLGSDDGENDAYISKGESFIRISYGLEEAIEFSYEEKANAFRKSIVDYACQFIGNPYVWGGTSLTRGCDCSGYVQQIMRHFGISMERTSYYQVNQGSKRTSSTMRPGDLIFYAGKNGTVNHVGIYIGGGYMVGAQSKRAGIKVVRWNYRTPVAIRDVIGDRIE